MAGSCLLGLSADDWAKGRDRVKGIGFRLFAETTQDLEATAANRRSRSIEVDGPKNEPWLWVADITYIPLAGGSTSWP